MAESKRTLLERIDHNTILAVGMLVGMRDELRALEHLGHQLVTLAQQTKAGIATMNQQITDLIAQFNTATNDVAARIDRILAAIGNQVDPAQVAELTAIKDHLVLLGQDPANPVPTPTV